jgi:hypothetical protein
MKKLKKKKKIKKIKTETHLHSYASTKKLLYPIGTRVENQESCFLSYICIHFTILDRDEVNRE